MEMAREKYIDFHTVLLMAEILHQLGMHEYWNV